MPRLALLALSSAFAAASYAGVPANANELRGMRSLALSPDGSKIAFVYRGDIWVAPSEGGLAVPITNSVEMDDYPVWSPDGKYIAFASNRTGNNDIFIAPVNGGETRRLTWFSGSDIPKDWSADGKTILLAGGREGADPGIMSIDVNTGAFKVIFRDWASVSNPRYSADGKSIIYQRLGFAWTRPRYEGSGAAQLYSYDLSTGKRTQLLPTTFQQQWANPTKDGIYFVTVSEKTPSSSYIGKPIPKIVDNVNRTPNVYKYSGGKATRITDSVGEQIRFLTAGGGKLAYERGGYVYIQTGKDAKKSSFYANLDPKTAQEERLILTSGANNATFSPDNNTVVFSVRSELWKVPVKKGKGPNANDAEQLTDYPGIDEAPIYAPDGKSVFFVSDREGAQRLYRLNLETKAVTPVSSDNVDHSQLTLSPDKKYLMFFKSGKDKGIYRVPVAGGTVELVAKTYYGGEFAVSPDGRWIAFSRPLWGVGINPWESGTNLWLREIATGKEYNLTQLNAQHTQPSWSPDGRFLYFRGDREGRTPELLVIPASAEDARTTELELKYTKPSGTPKVDFDVEGTQYRIRRFITGAIDGNIRTDAANGDVYFLRGGDIWKVDYSGENLRQVTSGGGIGSFEFSADGNQLQYIKGGLPNVTNIRSQNMATTSVAFRAEWLRNVTAERKAAFMQYWSIYNNSFYDANFHGRDWLAIRNHYEPYLESVGHRNEMAIVLNMMTGELEASHSEVSPGPGNPSGPSSVHPGFTFDYSYSGKGIKVLEVPKGAPGSYPKTKINPGEYILTINGKEVSTNEDLYKILNDQGGRDLVFTVNSTPNATGARTVQYRSLTPGEWSGINYRNKIEARRAMVDKLSNGQLAYLHIAGMGGGNMFTFQREAWQFVQGKKGVIIDVRENGGGNIADSLLDQLERRPQGRYLPRDGEEVTAPGAIWPFPTVVMMAETSFSNAEMFPMMMKARKFAQLVGRPTPGYVIYTSGSQLVDGTIIRIPGTGVHRLDGSPLENMGEQPDYNVVITPEQYFAGKDPQLEKAIEVLLKQLGARN